MRLVKRAKRHLSRLFYEPADLNLISNVYGTKFGRAALLSYLTSPFTSGVNASHTNLRESATWAELLKEEGFEVDMVDWQETLPDKMFSKYEIVAGFGKPFVGSLYAPGGGDRQHIFYGTMAYPLYSNRMSLERVLEQKAKIGKLLLGSSRLFSETFQVATFLADRLIVVGNKNTLSTYRKELPHQKVSAIPLFFYQLKGTSATPKKDWTEAKRNLLWIGSSGLLHKGLDIAIEVARRMPNLRLHVCGPIDEADFKESFLARPMQNVCIHGFVDVESKAFERILATCGAVLYPSASEGQAVSVLTACGNGGLVPIITRQSGIDIADFGFVLDHADIDEALMGVEKYLRLSEKELEEMGMRCFTEIRKNHTYENFRTSLKAEIRKALSGS